MSESDLHLPPSDPGLSLAEFCLGGEDVSQPALPEPIAAAVELPPDVEGCLEEPTSTRCG